MQNFQDICTVKKLAILFLFFAHALFAHPNDSLKASSKVSPLKYYTMNQFEYKDSFNYPDNSLLDFQNYLPKNTLGNVGLPFNDFIYKTSRNFGFNYQRNYYSAYFFKPSELYFYNTRIPYTNIFFVFGAKQEQYFKLVFSYNVNKNWNVTANFSRIKSNGFYQKLRTDHTSLFLSTNYRTSDNRYMLLGGGGFNTLKNEENGGMVSDTNFFNGSSDYSPSFADANNYRFNKNIFLKQYLHIGHKVNDSAPIIPSSMLILASQFDGLAQRYRDANIPKYYYDNYYYDTLKSHDSVYTMKIENELAGNRVDNLKRRGIFDMIGAGAGLKHQYIKVRDRRMDSLINNILISAELNNLYSKNRLWWKLKSSYGLEGYNKEDYQLCASITKGWKDSLSKVSLVYQQKAYAPDFMYTIYHSNHFEWIQSLGKTTEQSIAAGLFMDRYDLAFGADLTNFRNVVYFDTVAIARQYGGNVQVISLSLKKNFSFFNWHLNNKIEYQQVPDSSVIRVPQWILQHALYYENDLFKKALRLQVGFQAFYNTAYYANAYMPATGQFYLQNKNTYGNYPVIDFFLNLKIKVVNIFFKIDHLNAGFSGNTYMLTPHYILNQRSFKFGVSWKFWD